MDKMPKRFIVSSTLWGNMYVHRYYLDGKRVKQWEFDSCFNTMSKSGCSYTRTLKHPSSVKYQTIYDVN